MLPYPRVKECFEKSVLDNGVRVLTERIPYVWSATIGFWIRRGAVDEDPTRSGISHFLEHMFFKGTKSRTARDIALSLERVGGYVNAFTSKEHTCLYARVLDRNIEDAVDVLVDMLTNSVFSPVHIDREKKVVLEEISDMEDTPEEYLHELFGKLIWGEHPLGNPVLGSRESVSAFDRETILDWLRNGYTAGRMVVSATGNIDHEKVVGLVDAGLNGIPLDSRKTEAVATPKNSGRRQVFHKDLNQHHVCLGTQAFSATDPRRFSVGLLATLLGGGMSSRLFQSLREEMGLVYSIESFAEFFKEAGMFGVTFSTAPQTADSATNAVFEEFEKLRTEGLEESELQDAKEELKGSLLLGMESTTNRMTRLAKMELYMNKFMPTTEVISQIEGVTEEDVIEAADQLLDRDSVSLVVLGAADGIGRN
jgi:predicted Zn-dependent peptidase